MDDAAHLVRGLEDSIVAVATAQGVSERGVIRLSGDRALPALEPLFEPFDLDGDLKSMRYGVAEGRLVIGRSGVAVDVLVYVMRGPHSFTGEDQVELHLPGSPMLLDMVVELFRRAGLRPARAGEFTERAFRNGRMDLSQAEGVAALIHARSESERQAAVSILSGEVSAEIAQLEEMLLLILGKLELDLDFSDQDIDIVNPENLGAELQSAQETIKLFLARRGLGAALNSEPRVVLLGPPNAGKSSLFNLLAEEELALVSNTAGTTRDFLEARINCAGIDICLIDTAGEGFTASQVDEEAHRLRGREIDRADLLLYLNDATEKSPFSALPNHAEVLCVLTQIDRLETPPSAELAISVQERLGIVELKDAIAQRLGARADFGDQALLRLNQRHRDCLERALVSLDEATKGAQDGAGYEVIAADLHESLACLGEITGVDYEQRVLDGIMRDFCIGK